MQDLLGFIVAGFALAGSPGPNTLSLAATGAAFGARRGLAYMAGLNAGMLAVMAITASGMIGILLAVPGARPAVTAVAAGYFVYLAWRIATAPPIGQDAGDRRQPPFLAGVTLSLVNPKAYAAMSALFSGFVLVPGRIGPDIAAKIGTLVAVVAIVNIAWLASGAVLTRFFRDPRASRAINLGFAALLLASVGLALAF